MSSGSQDLPLAMVRALRIIEETGSVSEAARTLGISQPAVSKGIAQLEKRFGLELLIRGARPLVLTEEGQALAAFARQADLLQDKTLRQLQDVQRDKIGTVRLGSFGSSASFHILPRLLDAFGRRFPGIEVEIYEFPDAELETVLRNGGVDAAILSDPHKEDLDVLPLASDELVALVREDHPLAARLHVTAADLCGDPFILTKGGSAPLVEKWFAAAGQDPKVAHTILQVNSILALVAAGLGVSIIAKLALPPQPDSVKVLPLSPTAPRSIILARIGKAQRSRAAQTFWQFCEGVWS